MREIRTGTRKRSRPQKTTIWRAVFVRFHVADAGLACRGSRALSGDAASVEVMLSSIAGSMSVTPSQPELVNSANVKQYKLA